MELFVGAGGLGMGVSQAGFRTVLAIDKDRWACDTVKLNQDLGLIEVLNWNIVKGHVQAVDYSQVADEIHLVAGGPPCQPFSLGGRHAGHLDPRDMFPEAIRAVRELRPKAFLFENVKGLNRTAFSTYLEYISLCLTHPHEQIGGDEGWADHLARLRMVDSTPSSDDSDRYTVVSDTLNAANFGVPQHRERVFLIGLRQDLGLSWKFPEPTHTKDALLWHQWRSGEYWERHQHSPADDGASARDIARAEKLEEGLATSRKPWLTVRDALVGLPDPEWEPAKAAGEHDHLHIPGARTYKGHTGSPYDWPAKTLKAGVHGVPGGENMLRREDGSVRYFTIREAVRLQTFPDEIRFEGSWGQVMRQLGNAVPTELGRILASRILRLLQGQESDGNADAAAAK